MSAEKKKSLAMALVCLLSIALWTFSLFKSSVSPESADVDVIVDSVPVIDLSDPGLRYREFFQLALAGLFGIIVASIVSIVGAVICRTQSSRSPVAYVISIGTIGTVTAAVSACILYGVVLAFDTSSFLPGSTLSQRLVALVLIAPGICIYVGGPAFLGGIGASSLLHVLMTAPPAESVDPGRTS